MTRNRHRVHSAKPRYSCGVLSDRWVKENVLEDGARY